MTSIETRYVNQKAVAAYMGIAESSVRVLIRLKDDPLPTVYFRGFTKPRYDLAQVDAWIERNNARCA